jgi:hypothetical protein
MVSQKVPMSDFCHSREGGCVANACAWQQKAVWFYSKAGSGLSAL